MWPRCLIVGLLLAGLALTVSAADRICAACRGPITGDAVELDGAFYHREHLVCLLCGKPIRAAAYVVEGRTYHAACWKDRSAPRCTACRKPITGDRIEFDGRPYHPACHEKLAPRCGVCGAALEGSYVEHEGRSYHDECWRRSVAPRCAYCGLAIEDDYVEDYWKNLYHATHRSTAVECDYCGRYISAKLTGGGGRYPDGRAVCGLCRRTAVNGQPEADALLLEAAARLETAGLRVDTAGIRLRLVDRVRMKALHDEATHRNSGFTAIEYEEGRGRRRITSLAIHVLSGMPRREIFFTLSHELMHVWLARAGRFDLDPALKEGSCNLAAAMALRAADDSPEAGLLLHRLDVSDDAVYGEGYRRVRRFVEERGAASWRGLLRTQLRLPSGY